MILIYFTLKFEIGNLELLIQNHKESLANDTDERVQQLLSNNQLMEKEISSLKAVLEIKHKDLLDLRTKNNELFTKVII